MRLSGQTDSVLLHIPDIAGFAWVPSELATAVGLFAIAVTFVGGAVVGILRLH